MSSKKSAAAKSRPTRNARGGRQPSARRTTASQPSAARRRANAAARGTMQAGRYLWAVVTALVIAALLFEPTMVWTLGVGVYMVAAGEFTGLWLIVLGYVMACTPAAFGMLVATGRFWPSFTHALWIGAVYAVVGFLLLGNILELLEAGLPL